MPRTKRSRASNSTKDRETIIKTFEKHAQLRIAKLERDARTDLKSFEACIEVIIARLPVEVRQMTLGELIDWQNNQKENRNDEVSSSVKDLSMQPPVVPKYKKVNKTIKRTTATTSDDGYATESTSIGSTSRAAKTQLQTMAMRTRSSTRANRPKLSDFSQTPMSKPPLYDVVTPKIKPNTPLNVLRRPRQGEMVLSMQGSPLLVSAVVEEKTANINVPLSNGSVMSLLPQEGLRMSNIPPLDPETMHQLKTLKNHIEKVISLK